MKQVTDLAFWKECAGVRCRTHNRFEAQ